MNYRTVAQNNTFIRHYMDYMNDVETPQSFDFHTGLYLIGARLNGSVHVDRPRFPVYLGTNLTLVSNSGYNKREANIRTAKALSTDEDGQSWMEHDYLFPKGNGGRDSAEDIVLNYGAISNVTSTTPVRIIDDCHPSATSDQVVSRFLFVYDNDVKKAIAWPKPKEGMMDFLHRFLDDLVFEARKLGRIELNNKALQAYTRWHRSRYISRDPILSGYFSKEDEHLLRVAALLSINDGTFQIQQRHITKSISIVRDSKTAIEKIFGGTDVSKQGRIADAIERIRHKLIEAGGDGILERKLLQIVRTQLHSDEYKIVIRLMHEIGVVDIIEERKTTRGRPKRTIFPTNAIRKDLLPSEVLSYLETDLHSDAD